MKPGFRSGFVGMIGRTNVGKSTLINKILKQKVVISTDKVQTTRNKVNCIYNTEDVQIIFVDCPGFFKPINPLTKRLNNIVYGVLKDVDLITVIVDVSRGIGTGDLFVIKSVMERKQPKILLLNKIDKVSSKKIEQEMEKIKDFDFFEKIIPVSARTGKNIEIYIEKLTGLIPEGPMYFPDDMLTDQPMKKYIGEIIREKAILNLSDELPHGINIDVEEINEEVTKKGEDIIKISCSIIADKKSHKGIIIGKSGRMLKKIGSSARNELENYLGKKVFLNIWVKVIENWTKNESVLTDFGYQ